MFDSRQFEESIKESLYSFSLMKNIFKARLYQNILEKYEVCFVWQ